jgi:hypothetical protein
MVKVVEFPGTNLMDIPAMLRKLADEIHADPSMAKSVLVVIEDSEFAIHTRGYGGTGDMTRAVGMLAVAQYDLLTMFEDIPGQ